MTSNDNDIHSILTANDVDHARYRRLLSHAFSKRAFRQQEYLLLRYIGLSINQLTEKAKAANPVVDMLQWLNFTTSDIVGDLAFGELFHCLEESRYQGRVSTHFAQFATAVIFVSLRFFGFDRPIKMLLPSSLLKKRAEHANLANDRIHRRLGTDAQRNDFMTYVLRYNDEKGMSVSEIEATFRTLVGAGSEMTATAMSGIMIYLLRNQDAYDKLTQEVRSAFSHKAEICAERVSDLVYLNAVIEEGLRLCPPVALGLPRLVPPWWCRGFRTVATCRSEHNSSKLFLHLYNRILRDT